MRGMMRLCLAKSQVGEASKDGRLEEASGSEPASIWAGMRERLGRAPGGPVVGQGVWPAVA
jgi:hypothetical protein